jgi:hypothetical protein
MFPEPSDLTGTRKGASHFSNSEAITSTSATWNRVSTLGVKLADNEATWHEGVLFAGEVLRNAGGRFRPGRVYGGSGERERKGCSHHSHHVEIGGKIVAAEVRDAQRYVRLGFPSIASSAPSPSPHA